VRALIAPASAFSASTKPTDSEVTTYLSSGCSVINAHLAAHGYGAIPTTSAAYDLARAANALYAAWHAEDTRVNATISADERTRGDRFKRSFFDHLKMITGMDLSYLGVSKASGVYMGGISLSDKATVEGDSDRVPPRFVRGMGRHESRTSYTSSNNDEQARDDD
jgi:hypothetical protein